MTTKQSRPGVGTEGGQEAFAGAGADSTEQSAPFADPTGSAICEARPLQRMRRTNAQLAVIHDAIMEALSEEHPATLRGTYYRVVSAGVVDKTDAGYKMVGREVLKLRRTGVLPYWWITDGTRYVIQPRTWNDLDAMLTDAAASYRRALWHDQQVGVHIFTEKDAITGVISDVCNEWDVPLGVLRGYASESFCWSVAESLPADRTTFMYQLGDHDPSGVDAWRNFADKVVGFAPDKSVVFERLAVLPEQITEWNLLTRPTKRTDTRSAGFVGESVEVDAIRPSMLRTIVRNAIEQHIDPDDLAYTRRVETWERDMLTNLISGAR